MGRPSRRLSRRGLWTLASLALIAGLVMAQSRMSSNGSAGPARLTPGLEDELAGVSRIEISGAGAAIALCLEGEWHLCDLPQVPARRPAVRQLLFDLARIDIVEVKTQEPARWAALDLTPASPAVVLRDETGEALLQLALGKLADEHRHGRYGAEMRGRSAFVLAGVPDLPTGFADWADLPIPRPALSGIAAVRLAPNGAAPLDLLVKAGRVVLAGGGLVNEAAAQDLIAALAAFAPDAARTQPPPVRPDRIVLSISQGGRLVLDLAMIEGRLWLHYPEEPALQSLWLRAPAFQAQMIARDPAAYRLAR